MRRIPIKELRPGLKLGKDLYSFDGRLLLSKGTVIAPAHLERLAKQGISEVYVLEPARPGTATDHDFATIYRESLDTVKSFMLEAKLGKPLPKDDILGVVDVLLEHVLDEIDVFGQLRLMKDKDEYLFVHSVNVAILAILIARWLKCDRLTVTKAGLAGILHDIGKIFIAPDILGKPESLSAEEFEEMKKHTILGYNLVSQYDWVDADVGNAVLMHHEKMDGCGYPLGIKGEAIGLLARVVTVADVYDAITSDRVYSPKETPYKAAEVLWEESFGKLDPRVTRVFYDRTADFYVGQRVRLSNGEEGKVIFVDRSYPTRPLVQVGDKFYDLNLDRGLTIKEILD